ncbi:hypothetical protein [Acinetobacter bereziniae]|nr:hypothetical protein [Acinetobacter bereziniae]
MWIKQQTLNHVPQQLLSRLKPHLIGLLAALTLGLSLSGCVTTPNPVKQAADKLVGQHVNKAIDIFGSPTYRVPASKLGGSAMWENSIVSQHVVQ